MEYFKNIPEIEEYLVNAIDKPNLELEVLFGTNFKTNPIKKIILLL